jgi:protein-S-isoprenylcysteine O-methyltransferase Ste14
VRPVDNESILAKYLENPTDDLVMNEPSTYSQKTNLLKSVLHNIGVVAVGFGFAFLGRGCDWVLGITGFDSLLAKALGSLLITVGFLLRVWATFDFYERRMKVISLVPQKTLITSGPYRFSRNPLYLGGNVFIFLGAVSILGSPSGIVLTVLNIVAVDFMIRREEKQLERDFGEEWASYRNRVRRWL